MIDFLYPQEEWLSDHFLYLEFPIIFSHLAIHMAFILQFFIDMLLLILHRRFSRFLLHFLVWMHRDPLERGIFAFQMYYLGHICNQTLNIGPKYFCKYYLILFYNITAYEQKMKIIISILIFFAIIKHVLRIY